MILLTVLLYAVALALIVYIILSIRRTKSLSVSDAIASLGAVLALLGAVGTTPSSQSQVATPTALANTPVATINTSTPDSAQLAGQTATAIQQNTIFNDDFKSDTRTWVIDPLKYNNGDFTTKFDITQGVGIWSIVPSKALPRTTLDLTTTLEVGNLDLHAEMRLTGGEPDTDYGVTFRNGSKGLYVFAIEQDKFVLFRIDDTGNLANPFEYMTRVPGTEENYRKSDAINVGGWNELRVIMKDTKIDLYINSEHVFDIINRDLDKGNVGLVATISGQQSKAIEVRKFQVVKVP